MKANLKGTKTTWKNWINIALFVAVVYLLYAATLQPLVTSLFVPSIEHTGVDLYFEDKYLKYDHSEAFRECISYIPLAEDAEVRHFAFYDSRWRDNIFHGRFPDVYVLDIDAGIQYDEFKSFVLEKGEGVYSGTYYWLEDAPPSDDKIFVVRLYDDEQIVRCTMLSHYDNDLNSAHDVSSTLGMYFPLNLVGPTYVADN